MYRVHGSATGWRQETVTLHHCVVSGFCTVIIDVGVY